MIDTPWQVYEIISGKTERAFETEAEAEDFRFDLDDDGGVYDVRMYVLPTLKDRIIEMMTENTGTHFLDSGGANGRRWQRNQLIDDWDAIPVVDVDVCSDDYVIIGYSTYHYLMNFLNITEESERLNDVLKEIMAESEDSYMADMEEFLSMEDIETDGYACHNIINSYNYENIIDHVLQYAIFENEGETYIIFQVHLGCDIRSGMGTPQIFAIPEPDYFIMAQEGVYARCDCSVWDSDDGGAHYYFDGSCPSPDPDWVYDADNDRVTCRKCGKEVVFSVTECW